MIVTEKQVIDRIEIVKDGFIQVRQCTIIEKDGEEISRTFHRWILTPDMDISNQEEQVQLVANAAWTPEVKTAYALLQQKQEISIP